MLRLTLVALIVAVTLAVKFLPWYVTLGGVILAILSLPLFLRVLLKLPFKAKGRVLRGAKVTVHAVEPTSAPAKPQSGEEDDEEEQEESTVERRWYRLDATITPAPAKGAFHLWEAGELVLVRPECAEVGGDGSCTIHQIEVEHDGHFEKDQGMKYPGTQRMHFLIGVAPDVRRLKFQYYFESFGDVAIPVSARAARPA